MVNSRKEGNHVGGSVNSPRIMRVSRKARKASGSRSFPGYSGMELYPILLGRPSPFFVQPVCRPA
ncbi:MAG: hypothetical protein EB090_04885 [Verrucomicrobia bacterium]|nr:hypothetical protein [Verrucomicrobiota bacterium]